LPSESRPSAVSQSAAERRQAAKEITKVERQLTRLTARERELHAELAEHASDYTLLTALDADLQAVTAEMARLEARWFELAELAEDPAG
jgi:ATP-binding cassette subfamily F protein uup